MLTNIATVWIVTSDVDVDYTTKAKAKLNLLSNYLHCKLKKSS